MSKTLKLYRGIYTDREHAEIIREKGFDEKWNCSHGRLLFDRNNIDEVLKKERLKLDDVVDDGHAKKNVVFASGTKTDACFYALRNKEDGYIANMEVKEAETYSGEKELYILEFSVSSEDVIIDANDSLYPICYKPEKWEGTRYDKLCKIFSKAIIDKYKPLLLNEGLDKNALCMLMSAEEDAILSMYKNDKVLIYGRRGVVLFSSFKVFSLINEKSIIAVDRVTEEECLAELNKRQTAISENKIETIEAWLGN